MNPVLFIVVPCYNEEEVLPVTLPVFLETLSEMVSLELISEESRILLVDDGSKDGTWDLILQWAKKDQRVKGISLSRNQGHQNALLAGLMEAKEQAEITISIDADGQDDPGVMKEMVRAYHRGAEVVYGVRSDRKTDTLFKRSTAQTFYRLMAGLGVEVVYNHADYRLASSRVLRELAGFGEVNLFLRGMFPLVGFQSTSVFYERKERLAGKSKYPFRKMLALALNGITSLSVRPLRIITVLGIFTFLMSIGFILWSVIAACTGNTVPGWASMLSVFSFFGGVEILSVGILGEYVGKIYMETKHRPKYIVEKRSEEGKKGQGSSSNGEGQEPEKTNE